MRIGQPQPEKKRRLKPPPNYSSRGMQWRLLAAVAALMMVLTLAFEARNPDHWKWLAQLDQIAAPQEEIDPRLAPPGQAASDEVVIDERSRPKLKADQIAETVSSDDRAWASGWEEIFGLLSNRHRQSVYELLKAARDKQQLPEPQQPAVDEALGQLDRHWADYRATARLGIEDLSEEEQAAWVPVLERLELRWTVETKPLLMMVAQGQELGEKQRSHLVGVQDLLDRLELKAIQDNTPWRASEREIWFRLLGKLQRSEPEQLRRGSVGQISYAQLFKQSDVYRGKLVTIRGTANDVHWVQAPANSYGIQRYWVYWLRPAGGPNSPILVYSLHKPEGFPFVDAADSGRGKMPGLEDVEFTGFYFKRYAYEGQGGLFTAPMLLAREPVWLKSSLSTSGNLPSPVTFLAVAAGLALLATGLAVWVYYQYRPGRIREVELPARVFVKPE